MAIFEIRSSGARRDLVKRFERKAKGQAVNELVDIHLMHCARAETLETLLAASLEYVVDADLAAEIRRALP